MRCERSPPPQPTIRTAPIVALGAISLWILAFDANAIVWISRIFLSTVPVHTYPPASSPFASSLPALVTEKGQDRHVGIEAVSVLSKGASRGDYTETSQQHSEVATATATLNIIHEAFLRYSEELQANADEVEFNGAFSLSATGNACFNFHIANPTITTTKGTSEASCPHPYIRLRLSGSALVHVPLARNRNDSTGGDKITVAGCALLPVPGTYYVDGNLIHCRMSADGIASWDSKRLKRRAGLPVIPDHNVSFVPHKFVMPPFVRTAATTAVGPSLTFTRRAWVWAPPCRKDLYTLSAKCTQQRPPKFMSTKFQTMEWLSVNHFKDPRPEDFFIPRVHKRFDGYMWLPVDPMNGTVDYDAEHFDYESSPMPHSLQQSTGDGRYNKTVLFVGASHARYLRIHVSQVYYNQTGGHDACEQLPYNQPPSDLQKNMTRFGYSYIRYSCEGSEKPILHKVGNHYDIIILTFGHWDAGFPGNSPTTPSAFIKCLLDTIARVEERAKPGAEIFVTTVNQSPMGRRVIGGRDWRIPPLIDMYNDEIRNQVDIIHPIKHARSFPFQNRSRTFLLDGTDILEPIWDSATDMYHPCRYFVPPMALRVLDLLKD